MRVSGSIKGNGGVALRGIGFMSSVRSVLRWRSTGAKSKSRSIRFDLALMDEPVRDWSLGASESAVRIYIGEDRSKELYNGTG